MMKSCIRRVEIFEKLFGAFFHVRIVYHASIYKKVLLNAGGAEEFERNNGTIISTPVPFSNWLATHTLDEHRTL